MTSKALIVIGAVVLLGAGVLFFVQSPEQPAEEETQEGNEQAMERRGETENEMSEAESTNDEEDESITHEIMYTQEGYSPATLTIRKGDTIVFRNESEQEMWPASAVHPSHTVYPGSGIQKCFDEDESNDQAIFDACRGLGQGEEYSFTFEETGEWRYHDHLQPVYSGSVIVEG